MPAQLALGITVLQLKLAHSVKESQVDQELKCKKTVQMERNLIIDPGNYEKDSELREFAGNMPVFLIVPKCCWKFASNVITATSSVK